MSKLVIAEKPMLARDIARAICGRDVSETALLPIRGNGYTVIACAGHLLELDDPQKIDAKWGQPWMLDALPIEIPNWPKVPVADKKSLVDAIALELDRAESVIAAGDPDDEGQLIVDELLDYLGYTGKVERVYVNDNIEKNIVRAFENLVPNEECRGAGNAAYARQMADAAFGFNETRLATLKLHAPFTVGRVQTPTLGLVVTRDEAIEKHTVRKYYELTATGNVPDTSGKPVFRFKPDKSLLGDEKYLFEKDSLEALKKVLDGTSRSFETVISKKTVNPPLPYNLTVLLSDMSERYGFSATKTQRITQDLRDKYKAITYNRSDSQYLKEEHFAEAETVLMQAMRNLGVSWKLDYTLRSKTFNDKNVTAHHGIIPQEVVAPVDKMTADEQKVYTAIVERYAAQFLPPAAFDVSESGFAVDGGEFVCTLKRLTEPGFSAMFPHIAAIDAESDLWISEGLHMLNSIECSVVEKATTPPKPYTEGTLIADMASIAKYVTDPEMKSVLKKKDDGKKGEHGGIGTTATRSSILENLKKRGYLEKRKGKIRATDKAKAFYHLLPPEIAGADVTAKWWLIQQDVADGKADVNAVQRSVIAVFNQHRDSAYDGVSLAAREPTVGKCPLCGKDVTSFGKVYSCSSNKSKKQPDGTWKQTAGCGFKLFPTWSGKKLTEKQVQALLSGKCITLKGCISAKTGKTFDCRAVLEGGKVKPIFDSKKTSVKRK